MTAQSLVFSAGRYKDQAQPSNELRKPGVGGVVCATVTVFARTGRRLDGGTEQGEDGNVVGEEGACEGVGVGVRA